MERENRIAWLQGLYVQQAIMSVTSAVLGGSKARPYQYPKEPINFDRKTDTKAEQEKERLKAVAFFKTWASASKSRFDARASE